MNGEVQDFSTERDKLHTENVVLKAALADCKVRAQRWAELLGETEVERNCFRREWDESRAENAQLKAERDNAHKVAQLLDQAVDNMRVERDEALARLEQRKPVLDAIRAALDSLAKALAMLEEPGADPRCCCREHLRVGRCLDCPVHGLEAPAVEEK